MEKNLRHHPNHLNHKAVTHGFAYVGKVLEPYTRAGLQKVYHDIYRHCAGLPPCLHQCSYHHKRDVSKWCSTCKGWKNQLLFRRRGTFSCWENTESWQWNVNFEKIISVFLPTNWSPSHSNLGDLSTACHIWGNCKEFNISKSLLSTVKSLRNKTFAHNPDLKVNENEKRKVFNVLKTLLHTNAVQAHINLATCMQELGELEKGNDLTDILSTIPESTEAHQQQHAGCHTRQEHFKYIMQIEESRRNEQIHQETQGRSWTLLWITLVLRFILMTNISKVDHPPYDDCISETYSHPFPQDLYLLPYVGEHGYLFGRQWLLKEIETNIFQSSSTNKGVLLTADMGGGKSAIVKHLLCSKENEKGNQITRSIVAFHVCKFDVPSTKNAQRFVYRLVGFLSTSFPEFGELISMLPRSAILYDHEKCRREIEACFDQGVGQPLRMLQHIPSSIQIVIIDALDECYEQYTNKNELFDLLKVRYRDFPKWLKFIITSRNSSQYDALFMNKLTRVHMNSIDERNHNDIRVFYDFKANVYPQITNVSVSSNQFVQNSEGNFLHAVNSLELLLKRDHCNQPKSIDEIYDLNFRRYFPSSNEFSTARQILEIVLASIHPLSKSEIATILSYDMSTENLTKSFDNLMFCLRTEKEVTFVHQSYHKWLIDDESVQFHITIENGHAAISQYFLTHIKSSKCDVVDIAIHVSMSNDTSLIKHFEVVGPLLDTDRSGLHRLIWKSKSVTALRLLLQLYQNIDTFNEGNVTAAFVAASNGNLDQLKLLHSNGANLNFTVNDSFLITSIQHISTIKNSLYLGYNLIHIATHNGHLSTVNYLIKYNTNLIHVKNGLGLTASEIACENGQLTVLKLLLEAGGHAGNCLYFAAKNGHVNIIDWLASKGLNMSCISKSQSNEAEYLLVTVSRQRSVIQTNDNSSAYITRFNMYDLWWKVAQESPLHASIEAMLVYTSSVLIHRYPHLTKCVDAYGMTPFLLSIVKNQTLISEMFPEIVLQDKCKPQDKSLVNFLSNIKYKEGTDCPQGASYLHLAAIHGIQPVLKTISIEDIDESWLWHDESLNTPVHYAACHGNVDFLQRFGKTRSRSYLNMRSKNGSTPYHSAAICGSLVSLEAMYLSSGEGLKAIKDNNNRSILHYVVLKDFTVTTTKDSFNQQYESFQIVKYLLRQSQINITQKDSFKRNLIHYALKNGHYMLVEYMNNKHFYSHIIKMVRERDINGISPVEYALMANIDFARLEQNLFAANCLPPCFSSIDYSLILLLNIVRNEVSEYFVTKFKIIVKRPDLVEAVLPIIEEVDDRHIVRQLIECIPTLSAYSSLSLHEIANYRPSVFNKCGQPLSLSPFHMLSYTGTTAPYFFKNASKFISMMFGNPVDIRKVSCADKRGLNGFHYSLIGGHIDMAQTLFDVNIDILNDRVSILDIPRMLIFGKKPSIELDIEQDNHISKLDNLLHAFLKRSHRYFKYVEICNERYFGLSLVHLIAISGLETSLNFLKDKFGNITLQCSNRDRLTPIYLWNLFNKRSSEEVFKQTVTIYPRQKTEKILLIHMLNDFPYGFPNSHLSCLLSNKANLKYKLLNCIRILRRSLQNESSIKGKAIQSQLNLMSSYIYAHLTYRQVFYNKPANNQILIEAHKVVLSYSSNWENRAREIKIPFNYPSLKQFNTQRSFFCDWTNYCSLNNYRMYKEFEHMVDNFVTHLKHKLFNGYRYFLGLSQPFGNDFFKRRLYLNREMSSSVFSDEKSKIYNYVADHSYLKYIQRTIRYKFFKDSIVSYDNITQFKINDLLSKQIKSDFVTITGAFDDILKYNQSSSYFTDN